jgi:tetratricopeptide (TPR) repeat protein
MQSPAQCQPTGDTGLLRRDARAHLDAGGYVEAEREARALIASLGGLAGENQRVVNRAADLLVEALARNGRAAEADTRNLAEELVRRRETASDTDASALATALRNLGDVLVQAGSYREGVVALERAQRTRQTAGTAGTLDAALDLDYLTLALLPVGRYDEALDISGRALALKQKFLAPGDTAIARTLEIRGRVWQRKGDYARARVDLERALAIREAASPRHPDMATTLLLLGLQFTVEGEIAKSRQFLERGLSLAEATLRADHPDVASLLRNLAIPVQNQGDLSSAHALQERAASIAEASLGRDHPLVADCLNDLAGTLLIQGEYVAARPLYQRALTIYDRRLGPANLPAATVLYNLAILHTSLGDCAP